MIKVEESAVQDAVKVMRTVKPYNPQRETVWQWQARVARAILESMETE